MKTYLDLATAIETPRVSRAPRASMKSVNGRAPTVPGGITVIDVTRPKSGKNKGAMRVAVSFYSSLYNPGTEAEHSPARRKAGKAQIDAQRDWFLACAIDAGFAGKNAKATMEAYALAKAIQAEKDGLAFVPPEPRENKPCEEVLVIVSRAQRAPYSGETLGEMHYLVSAPRIVKGFRGLLQINVQASTLVAYSTDVAALRASQPHAKIVEEWEYIERHAV